MKRNLLIAGIFALTLITCIDPYVLKLNKYESLLVVDGLITDESVPYTIKLSKTYQDKDVLPVMVTNAEVNVKDKNGNTSAFMEVAQGIYRSDPDHFIGKAGETYTLHIKTNDGLEYESTPCLMTPVPEIDSINFTPDKEFFDNGNTEETGIRIFVNTGNETGSCKYFRWKFEEVWKFKTLYPAAYEYHGGSQVSSVPVENQVCWKYRQSKEIIIHSTESQQTNRVNRQPLKFIAPARSDRLLQQYSILVKQYSLSEAEFEFWNNFKQVSESGGDIFEKQPFFIAGNIRCLNKGNEKILGYFQVSAVKQKRRYITKNDLRGIDLPYYRYPCNIVEVEFRSTPSLSNDQIYSLYTGMGYVFAYPMYHGLALIGMAFSTRECSDCSLTGDSRKPDFWVDLP